MPSVVPFSPMAQVGDGACPPLVSVRVIHCRGGAMRRSGQRRGRGVGGGESSAQEDAVAPH